MPSRQFTHQTEPKQTVDPAKATKQALDFIFFPYVHDPKSVLLKRGPAFLSDEDPSNERELMIFTHGFLLASVVPEDAFRMYLALSDREFLTEKKFLDYLQVKFRDMDEDGTGEVERWEVRSLFADLGIPMGASVLDELMAKSGIKQNGQAGKVGWGALHKAMRGCLEGNPASSNGASPGLDDSGHGQDQSGAAGGGGGLKKLLAGAAGAFQNGKKKSTRVECAALFSNVTRVDSLSVCHGDDPASREVANSSCARTAFSVTLSDRPDPLIFVCSKPEHRDSWVEAFKPGVVRATSTKSSDEGVRELRKKLGWQHLVVRSSLVSLVIQNDVESLECVCNDFGGHGSARKLRAELNMLDEYNGYSPLHYATILGHTECMNVLLEAGATVTMEDREGLSPMYHGKT